jgi:hypothetical protein
MNPTKRKKLYRIFTLEENKKEITQEQNITENVPAVAELQEEIKPVEQEPVVTKRSKKVLQ